MIGYGGTLCVAQSKFEIVEHGEDCQSHVGGQINDTPTNTVNSQASPPRGFIIPTFET